MIGGYLRGTIAQAAVVAAIHVAIEKGLSPEEIQAILARHGLVWDFSTDALSRRR